MIRFYLDDICLQQAFTNRFVKFRVLLPCMKAKCIGGTDTLMLAATLTVRKFWTIPYIPLHHTAANKMYRLWCEKISPDQGSPLIIHCTPVKL